MGLVTVLATGGTIATRVDASGVGTAQDAGADLVAGLALHAGTEVRVEDVLRVGSYQMDLDRMHTLAQRVSAQLSDPDVTGLVVTHGTDLLASGALPAGLLRPGQVRVLLAALPGLHRDPATVRAELIAHTVC